jgi:hypothetical protein
MDTDKKANSRWLVEHLRAAESDTVSLAVVDSYLLIHGEKYQGMLALVAR